MIEESAPAKLNLYLHVGPRRRDGLHELSSLFVFAGEGDRIAVAPAPDLSLKIEGPFAGELARLPVEHNLALKAARALKAASGATAGAAIRLDKKLPLASGIGGGSADAAATLRALARFWNVRLPAAEWRRLAFSLGADVPACLEGVPVFVSGAGERLSAGPVLPPLWAALVNPRIKMPTGPVFRDFDRANPAPDPPLRPPGTRIADYRGLVRWLAGTRNDLQPIAAARNLAVASVLGFLSDSAGCLAARMSGSGATVFGLYSSGEAASRAARRAAGRGWWSMSGPIGSGWRRLA